MKKKYGIILTLVLIVLTALPAYAQTEGSLDNFKRASGAVSYADVSRGSWYAANVSAVTKAGLMEGSYGYFEPDAYLTVAQAVTIAARFHSIYTGGDLHTYLREKPWYMGYYRYLDEQIGIPNDYYKQADRPADREQAIALLAQVIDKKDLAEKNTVYAIPDYSGKHAAEILTFYRAGVLAGVDAQGNFAPDQTISRKEIAAVLSRMFDVSLRERSYFAPRGKGSLSHFVRARSYRNDFRDVGKKAWYYENVREVYEKGIMEGEYDNWFGVNGTVRLCEVVTIAARLHNTYVLGDTDMVEHFPKGNHWYDRYFRYLESLGITDRTDLQNADTVISRARCVGILEAVLDNAALRAINKVTAVPDYEQGDYSAAVLRFYNAGILEGQDEYGTFGPEQSLKRTELAAITSRIVNTSLRRKVTLIERIASSFQYGTSVAGRPLTGYRVGNGSKVLVLTFAIHGWEDSFPHDGKELVNTGEATFAYLKSHYALVNGWSVYILPCVNPDGVYDGYSHNAFGRANKQGIDLNRSFPTAFERRTNSRNYTGSSPLLAPEAKALAALLQQIGGSKKYLVDVHGWLNAIITGNPNGVLGQAFIGQFPYIQRTASIGGGGYLIRYSRTLGYESALFEFPNTVYAHSDFVRYGYEQRFINAVCTILARG